MKKIITLVGAVLLFTTTFAQYRSDNNNDNRRDAVYGDNWRRDHDRDRNGRNDGYYNNYFKERDMKIAKINNHYDRKIESVKRRWFMSHSKKESIIYSLENQRREDIRMVYAKYNRYNDRRNW